MTTATSPVVLTGSPVTITTGPVASTVTDSPTKAIELDKLGAATLVPARWDAQVLDPNGVPPASIIRVTDDFKVRFRVQLPTGPSLWDCICGDWCFDMLFESIGPGTDVSLATTLGKDRFTVKDWTGCRDRSINLEVAVPAGTVPVTPGPVPNTLYRAGGSFQLINPCGTPSPVVGYEDIGTIQFYR